MYNVKIGYSTMEPFKIPRFYPGNIDYIEDSFDNKFSVWCADNSTDGYEFEWKSDNECSVNFDNEVDAVAFKLRWT